MVAGSRLELDPQGRPCGSSLHHHRQWPFGLLPELAYDVDLAEFRNQEASRHGSLAGVTKAIQELTKKMPS
jgi:hypothetical protein